jgi:hypothetical protein
VRRPGADVLDRGEPAVQQAVDEVASCLLLRALHAAQPQHLGADDGGRLLDQDPVLGEVVRMRVVAVLEQQDPAVVPAAQHDRRDDAGVFALRQPDLRGSRVQLLGRIQRPEGVGLFREGARELRRLDRPLRLLEDGELAVVVEDGHRPLRHARHLAAEGGELGAAVEELGQRAVDGQPVPEDVRLAGQDEVGDQPVEDGEGHRVGHGDEGQLAGRDRVGGSRLVTVDEQGRRAARRQPLRRPGHGHLLPGQLPGVRVHQDAAQRVVLPVGDRPRRDPLDVRDRPGPAGMDTGPAQHRFLQEPRQGQRVVGVRVRHGTPRAQCTTIGELGTAVSPLPSPASRPQGGSAPAPVPRSPAAV